MPMVPAGKDERGSGVQDPLLEELLLELDEELEELKLLEEELKLLEEELLEELLNEELDDELDEEELTLNDHKVVVPGM